MRASNTFSSSPQPIVPQVVSQFQHRAPSGQLDGHFWEICQGHLLAFFRRVSQLKSFRESSHAQAVAGAQLALEEGGEGLEQLGQLQHGCAHQGQDTFHSDVRSPAATGRFAPESRHRCLSAGPWPLGSPEVAAEHGPEVGLLRPARCAGPPRALAQMLTAGQDPILPQVVELPQQVRAGEVMVFEEEPSDDSMSIL